LEPCSEDRVVIRKPRVAGNHASVAELTDLTATPRSNAALSCSVPPTTLLPRFSILDFAVAHRQRDNAPRSRQDLLRVQALVRIALQVGHFTMHSHRQPVLKLRARLRRVGAGEPTVIKAQFPCALPDSIFHGAAACTRRN